MGKVRRSPHLLEAFHAARMGEGQEMGPGVPSRVGPEGASGRSVPLEVTLGEPAYMVLRLSAGVLVGAAVAAVVLLVGAFTIGRLTAGAAGAKPAAGVPPAKPAAAAAPAAAPRSGSRRASLPPAVSPRPSGSAAGTGSTAAAGPPGTPTPVYTVQVAVYGSGKVAQAEELKTFLLSKGIPDVMVIQVGNQYRVCVGRFPRADDEGAQLILKRVKELSPEFRSAFVNRLR